MTHLDRRLVTTGLAIGSIVLPTSIRSATSNFADIALCLSCDVSGSISFEEYMLQKNGLIKALTSDIMAKRLSEVSVAIIYHEWSGSSKFGDWFILNSKNDAIAFANYIEEFERSGSSETDMSSAINSAIDTMLSCPYEVGRKILDVSGDGPDPNLIAMKRATDKAKANNIRINGLPILDASEPDLLNWYETNVKTGPGSFVIPAIGFEDFERAMLIKIIGDMG